MPTGYRQVRSRLVRPWDTQEFNSYEWTARFACLPRPVRFFLQYLQQLLQPLERQLARCCQPGKRRDFSEPGLRHSKIWGGRISLPSGIISPENGWGKRGAPRGGG